MSSNLPEGFLAGSPGLAALSQWRMASQPVDAEPVWKALDRPDAVARTVRGETIKEAAFR